MSGWRITPHSMTEDNSTQDRENITTAHVELQLELNAPYAFNRMHDIVMRSI